MSFVKPELREVSSLAKINLNAIYYTNSNDISELYLCVVAAAHI